MELYGKIISIKKIKNTMFLIICNTSYNQIVIKGDDIDYYSNLLNIGDIVRCNVRKDLNNNGKYKTNYKSFSLIDLKIISKNVKNLKLPINKDCLLEYSNIKYNLRKYLHKLGYIEVDLPILTNGEISSKSDSFVTMYEKENRKFFLRKTMDVFLRMYSCSDINKIFSIGNCYRNEYLTSKYKPEFEMLSIFSNYMSKKEAINLATNILKIITSKNINIEYISDDSYKKITPSDNDFYIISDYKNLENTYCSSNTNNIANEFKVKYKGITIIHGVDEISDYNEYIEKIQMQGKKDNYGELNVLEDLINSGAPNCYNLGISIVRTLSLYNNKKIKDYDILSFDRLIIGGKNE